MSEIGNTCNYQRNKNEAQFGTIFLGSSVLPIEIALRTSALPAGVEAVVEVLPRL